MKYYDGHENTYRRLEVEGHTCWDRRAFDDFLPNAMRFRVGDAVIQVARSARTPSCS